MKTLLLGMLAVIWAQTAWAEAVGVAWSDLVDQSVQRFDDPYADLSAKQLQALIEIVQLRERLDGGQVFQEDRVSASARLRAAEGDLAEAGIDIDWLISQRWVVAERREAAAWAGNAALDGKTVILSGYTIPAPADADGRPSAYLVPERGMCSHSPPPAPNQMVRLRLNEDWAPRLLYEPVVVHGVLSLDPSKREVVVVDGYVPMHASFSLEVKIAEAVHQTQPMAAQNSAWVEQMKEKLRAANQEASVEN
ncbi:DUF3299 domain-containing protein [Shimia abyssi]|uniref:DUF3299 domain-containing protein n=1 Tax=Shimia abyssi TaxID=1662395 RepID=UPI0013FD6AA2|nr:DUF3299 domain-containing protein [Shimia abyssi]